MAIRTGPLISREDAKDTFCTRCDIRILSGLDINACREKVGCALMRWLDKVNTVDAEPVVRCKNCIHHEDCCCVICEEGNLVVCEIFHCHVNKDSFCSNGSKMDVKEQE